MKTAISPVVNRSEMVGAIVTRIATILFMLALQGILLFGTAGRLDWGWAWIFLGINLATILANAFFLRKNPATIAERGRPKEFKTWDKIIGGAWGALYYLAVPVIAGLDARFGWTRGLGAGWNVAGAVGFAAGMALFSWAMIANAYFSTAARIQTDRGQTVCRSGPYRFVRHPGYVGAILQSPGTALLLGSPWALIPAGAAAACMIVRTALEDRLLQNELAGYKEYAKDVAFRLIPGIW
jgi:protein-S-isoprenylcysteine O-methyltransferase Ste14